MSFNCIFKVDMIIYKIIYVYYMFVVCGKQLLLFLIYFLRLISSDLFYELKIFITHFPGVEMVGLKKREMCGVVLNYFYSIGEAFTGLVAWWSRDWVILQHVVSAPALLFIIYYWYKY